MFCGRAQMPYLCIVIEMITPKLFIRLVVNRFKVKIMLLDFQTTAMLVSVAIATILSVFTLTHTNIR
jgi:hypothetical protein